MSAPKQAMNEPGVAGYRNRLREVMLEYDLTVPEVARLTGISTNSLYSYRKNTHRLVPARFVRLLTDRVGFNPLELIEWTDEHGTTGVRYDELDEPYISDHAV